MAQEQDNLDEVVNRITDEVVKRLKAMGIGNDVATGGFKPRPKGNMATGLNPDTCHLSAEACPSCSLCPGKGNAAATTFSFKAGSTSAKTPEKQGEPDAKIASMIDHTLLKPDATKEQLAKICSEAVKYNFATVCVNSSNIPLVAKLLKGSKVLPIAVVGFPLGAATSESKAFEAKEAIQNGAREIDMVINIGAMKSKDYHTVYEDIHRVVEASAPYKVKVILETSQLSQDEKIIACALSKTAGAAFVKTSTGFGGGGATVEDIALMRKIVGKDMEVKASGGVRNLADAEAMIAAGADRIGASSSVEIVLGKTSKGNY